MLSAYKANTMSLLLSKNVPLAANEDPKGIAQFSCPKYWGNNPSEIFLFFSLSKVGLSSSFSLVPLSLPLTRWNRNLEAGDFAYFPEKSYKPSL